MKQLIDFLKTKYSYIDDTTVKATMGSRQSNTSILCYGMAGRYLNMNTGVVVASLYIQHIVGSEDDLFENKYIVHVNDKYVGVCETIECVTGVAKKWLCLSD